MLLAGRADSLNPAEIQPLFAEALQHGIQRLQPQCDRGEDFMLGFIGEDTLLDREPGRVGIEVELGDIDDFQIRVDDQALQLLGRQVEPDVEWGLRRHEG